jgi:Tol biopolymer transport system component
LFSQDGHEPPAFVISVDWSPEGSHIGFTQLDSLNQGEIFVMEVTDETGISAAGAVNLTENAANDCCLDWAPGGQRLLFLSSRRGTSSTPVREGTAQHPQTSLLLVRAGLGSDAAALSDAVRPLTTVVPEPPRDIYAVNRDGSELVKLTNGAGREKHATWSPDGKNIAFVSDRDGHDDIYVLKIDDGPEAGGRELYRLTDSPEDEGHPTWSPDGSCLAYVSYIDGETAIHVISADGRSQTKLAGNVVWGSVPSWSP